MMTPNGRTTALALSLSLAAATAGATTSSAQDVADQLVLKDFILTHGVMEREPIDSVDSFEPSDGQAYAFARIHNEGPPSEVTVVWSHEGGIHARVDLNVGTSTGWRTWSSANLKPGDWRVQLVDANGTVLDERRFMVDSPYGESDVAPAAYPSDDAPGYEPGYEFDAEAPGAGMQDADSSMDGWPDDTGG